MAETIQLKTFAWVREAIGTDEQACPLPQVRGGASVRDLLDALAGRDEAWRGLLASRREQLCFAVNHKLCGQDQVLAAGDEVAIFPPITGG